MGWRFPKNDEHACSSNKCRMQQRALFASLALAVVALAGCDDGDLPPATQTAPLSGSVIDSATKKPIVGATVTIDAVMTVTTDANGKFSIAKIPSGIVDYGVAQTGYTAVNSSVTAEPGKPLELDVSLDPIQAAQQ
jgi:hypothetical protein